MKYLTEVVRRSRVLLVALIMSVVPIVAFGQGSTEEGSVPESTAFHEYFQLEGVNYLHSDATALPVKRSAWETLRANLVKGLIEDDDAIRSAAMRLVIQYGNLVDVDDAVFDIVGIYRNHESRRMRQMAVVTLGATGNDWALDFLRRSLPFEKSAVLQRTITGVLTQHDTNHRQSTTEGGDVEPDELNGEESDTDTSEIASSG